MSFSRLQQVLLEKIQYYLEHDNPVPENDGGVIDGVVSSINAIFKETGRKRAATYRDIVTQSCTEAQLLRKVFDDLKESNVSRLETSTDLRKRIFQGLCEFFEISHDAQPPMFIGQVGYAGAGLFAGLHYQNQNDAIQRTLMAMLRKKVRDFLDKENTRVESYQPKRRNTA